MVRAGRQWEGGSVSLLGGVGRYVWEKIEGEDERVLGSGGEELVYMMMGATWILGRGLQIGGG